MEPQQDASAAATKIQAGFRGYKVRKQMKVKKNGPDEKTVKRCVGSRRKSGGSHGQRRASDRDSSNPNASDLEQKSATKIQAGIRGFLVRKKQKDQKPSQQTVPATHA